MKQSKKKKRSRVSKKGDSCNPVPSCKSADGEEQKVLKILMEAFASASLEEAASAYKEADGDPDKAAEILSKVVDSTDQEDQSTCTTSSSSIGNCIVGSSSSSNASDVFGDANDFLGDGFKQKSKPKSKKVIAVAGTVSAVLGKDYVRSTPTKSSSKLKEFHKESWSIDEAEQFLCSMLGEECELSLAVVSDVLCQCGFNLEKALDILLELSASSKEQVNSSRSTTTIRDGQYILESNDSLADRTSDSTSRSSEIEVQDNVWFTGNPFRSLSKVSGSSGSQVVEETGNYESELPQKVLESLFKMPTPRTAEHEPNTMNWRNVVKQLTSLGQRFEPGVNKEGPPLHAKGDEYQVHRAAAKQHWESMKSYYQKAAIAFTNGEKSYATYLSEKQESRLTEIYLVTLVGDLDRLHLYYGNLS
ncbi:hypothetical protein RD792_010264 [Penstemon davidsonii]|uniref:DUF1771 domain-containing protein n=1 Tax=Penstemon davidsonii TaxID=160366 RepID=A0ABR0D1D5_9LAMI|nr:hypothetical protein RD792_010264 [Penstemon davidsonii]